MGRMTTVLVVLLLLGAIAGLVVLGTRGSDPTPPGETGETALEAIRTELSMASPVSLRTDAQRLADARAWIAEHRDESWAYGDIEAWMLAQFEAMGDRETRSARWAFRAARGEVEMIRAIDADGDGVVSDVEVEAYAGFVAEMSDLQSHPYMIARFDADGDGVVSMEEAAWMDGDAQMGLMQGLIERGRLDQWDSDGDGVLSESETEAGRALALRRSRVFEDGHIEYVADPGENAEAEHEAVLARMAEAFGEDAVAMTLERREKAAEWNLASPLNVAMRLMEARAELGPDAPPMPAAPDPSLFDTDGDGAMDDQEGYMLALGQFQAEFAAWSSITQAMRARALFEAQAASGDVNGDGRLMADEWQLRIDDLVRERDERLFLMHYDTDGSGDVGESELSDFLTWYKADSLRADANFDGRVDRSDLEDIITAFEMQR